MWKSLHRLTLAGVLLAALPIAPAWSQQIAPIGVPPLPAPQTQPEDAQPPPAQPRSRLRAAIERVQGACKDELKTYCSTVTPGDGRLLLCMQAHEDKLGNACDLALFDASRNLEQALHRVERLAAACWSDIRAHCAGGGSIGQCIAAKRGSLSPPCRAEVAALQEPRLDAPAVAERTRRSWAGLPVYSAEGVRLGEVTGVRMGADGVVQMIQAELGGRLGFGSSMVLITPDEFEQKADGIRLRLGADQVQSILDGRRH
jgi:hypothetical protein